MSHSGCEDADSCGKNTSASTLTSPTATNPNQSSSSTTNQQSDNLSIFCREVRNLLRSKPNCLIPFSKFVPAYHNHYGRQCCVYQFGYTKLIELLESIPHVVQIISDSSGNRYITLTHREQIKRFASDLIKVVKSQPGKRLKLSQFTKAYEQVLGRQFRIEDYGTNDINVLLVEIWEGTINIIPIKKELADVRDPLFVACASSGKSHHNYHNKHSNIHSISNYNKQKYDIHHASHHHSTYPKNPILEQLVAATPLINKPYVTANYPDVWFEIPKRERSEKEIKRTKYFVWDVIELLSKMGPDYSVAFSKFIPSYHYYFNRQCKVSIFGFSKLIDLFESISPDVVEILDQGAGEEKLIRLAAKYRPPNNGRKGYTSNGFGRNLRTRYRISTRHSNPNANNNNNNNGRYPTSHSNRTSNLCDQQQRYNPTGGSGGGSSRSSSGNIENEDDSDDDIAHEDEIEDEEEEEEVDDGVDSADDEETADDMLMLPPMVTSSSSSGKSLTLAMHSSSTSSTSTDSSSAVGSLRVDHPIDNGPTEEELLELEGEIQAYEELKAIQSKRSTRMAALLDIFKRQAC